MLPPYVRPPGDPVYSPPYYFGTADRPWVACFLRLTASDKRLHELCNSCLNGPAGNEATFEPVNPYVWLVVNDYCRAGLEQFPDTGWLRYREITFQFAVAMRRPDQQASELRWFVAALYLDGTDATGGLRVAVLPILAGREISGLPKTAGAIEFRRSGFYDLSYARLQVLGLPPGGQGPLELQNALEVTVHSRAPSPQPGGALKDDSSLIAKLLDIAPGDIEPPRDDEPFGFIPTYGLRVDLSEAYGGRLLGLKQLHDAADFRAAAYQAVVDTSFRIDQEYKRRDYLYSAHRVQFYPLDDLDLPSYFGLELDGQGGVVVPDDHGIYLEARALLGRGETVVDRPPQGADPRVEGR